MSAARYAQIHRFRDKVAMSLGTGETVYLTPEFARTLGQQLLRYADDCEARAFVDSPLGTQTWGLT